MSSTVETAVEIRPFHVDIPEAELAELRRRIAATRWPSKELVDDRSQGVQLATLKSLADYWTSDYDFGRIVSSSSITDPGQPWVMISGSASSCSERTWMKWTFTPSISVVNCGKALSLASMRPKS